MLVYVITPSRGMLLVYNQRARSTRGRRDYKPQYPDWEVLYTCVARWFGATTRHQYCSIQPISISLNKRCGWLWLAHLQL